MKEDDLVITITEVKPVSKPLKPGYIEVLPNRYVRLAQKPCPTCKGSGKDPKKRKRTCPIWACREGQVPAAIPCTCQCHEGPAFCGFMSCCEYAGATREELEAAE